MAKIIDYNSSLDRRITTVHEAVETVNKKLTLLIRMLRNTVCPDRSKQQHTTTEVQENEPIEALQAKVDKHVLEVGLDTISHMGKFI